MTVIKTPLQEGEVELSEGDKYWKLVLPLNYNLNYNGRQIRFDKKYLENVKQAFDDQVMDQVAFQLANDDNAHDTDEDRRKGRHYDPQRFRGDIDQLEIRDNRSDGYNGLWARLAPTEAGLKLINDNKKLGVSASLRESYSHNGKVYPVVLRHVLGTLDPKIKGMGTWEKAEVSLSNDDDKNEEVIDLTAPTDTKPEDKATETESTEQTETVTVPKAEWDGVLEYINTRKQEDADAEKAIQEMAAEGNEDETELSEKPDPKYIELSNSVASERFERRADQWRREGVPNKMIELSRPVLSSGESFDIELSNGNKVDTKAVISAMLDEAKGSIDLSEQQTNTANQEEKDEEAKAIKALNDYLAGF